MGRSLNSSSIYFDLSGKEVPYLGNDVPRFQNETSPDDGETSPDGGETSPSQEVQNYGYLPCNCFNYTCGCCVNIRFFSFSRYSCSNFTYNPYEFSVTMDLMMDHAPVYQTSLSGKNPPPACIEAPIPYLPGLQFCAKLYDMYTAGRNMHACFSFITKLLRAPVLVLHFDCVQFGADGFYFSKPFINVSLPTITEDSTEFESSTEVTTQPIVQNAADNSTDSPVVKLTTMPYPTIELESISLESPNVTIDSLTFTELNASETTDSAKSNITLKLATTPGLIKDSNVSIHYNASINSIVITHPNNSSTIKSNKPLLETETVAESNKRVVGFGAIDGSNSRRDGTERKRSFDTSEPSIFVTLPYFVGSPSYVKASPDCERPEELNSNEPQDESSESVADAAPMLFVTVPPETVSQSTVSRSTVKTTRGMASPPTKPEPETPFTQPVFYVTPPT